MKLLILSSLLALAFGSNDRALQADPDVPVTDLEKQWLVKNPTVAYADETNKFLLNFEFGVASNSGKRYVIEFFEECPNGDAGFKDIASLGSPDNTGGWFYRAGALNPLLDAISWAGEPDGSNPATEKRVLGLKIPDPSVNTDIYSEADGVGTLEFCIRAGNWLCNADNGCDLVNFRQLLLTVEYSLTDGFDMTEFTTRAIEEVTDTAIDNDNYQCEASLCDGYAAPFNQGQQICVKVCSGGAFAAISKVTSITGMSFVMTSPDDATLVDTGASQIVVKDSASIGATNDQTCDASTGCCEVEFILNGLFFPVDQFDDPTIAKVEGSGDCLLSLLGVADSPRRLVSRALNEVSSKFDTEFDIVQQGSQSSGNALALGVAAVAAGAALLL